MKQKLLQEQEKLKKQLTEIHNLYKAEKKRLQELAGIYEDDMGGGDDVDWNSMWEIFPEEDKETDDFESVLGQADVLLTYKAPDADEWEEDRVVMLQSGPYEGHMGWWDSRSQIMMVTSEPVPSEKVREYVSRVESILGTLGTGGVDEGMGGVKSGDTMISKNKGKGEGEEGEMEKPGYASMNYRPGSRSFSTKGRAIRGRRAADYAPPHAGVHKPVKEGMIGKDPVEELLETISTELDFIQRFVDTNSNIPVNEKLEILKRVIGLQDMVYEFSKHIED